MVWPTIQTLTKNWHELSFSSSCLCLLMLLNVLPHRISRSRENWCFKEKVLRWYSPWYLVQYFNMNEHSNIWTPTCSVKWYSPETSLWLRWGLISVMGCFYTPVEQNILIRKFLLKEWCTVSLINLLIFHKWDCILSSI